MKLKSIQYIVTILLWTGVIWLLMIPRPTMIYYDPVRFTTLEQRVAMGLPGPIERYIRLKATERDVDPEMAVFIAEKESQFNPKARNPNSSAKGIFQFIDSTWKDLCKGDVLNPVDNINCAIKELAKGHVSHWTADHNMHRWLASAGYVK